MKEETALIFSEGFSYDNKERIDFLSRLCSKKGVYGLFTLILELISSL